MTSVEAVRGCRARKLILRIWWGLVSVVGPLSPLDQKALLGALEKCPKGGQMAAGQDPILG